MAGPLVIAFVYIRALEAVPLKPDFTLALSPPLVVGTEGSGIAAPIIFLALVDVLAVGAISNISTEADTAVASQVVVAAGLWVTAVQATETFIDVVAQQSIALVAHAAHAGKVVFHLQTLGLKVALAACCLAVLWVRN